MKRETRKRIDTKQKEGDVSVHHNAEKAWLLNEVLNLVQMDVQNVYEYFSGHNYLTKMYQDLGYNVDGNDIKDTGECSYRLFHKHIYDGKKYDIIDLDPYGLPFKFFPDVYLLLNDEAILFVTSVKYHIPILNWRRVNSFLGYFGKEKPEHKDYIELIVRSGLCHNYKVQYLQGCTMGKNTYRMAFKCQKIKSKQ